MMDMSQMAVVVVKKRRYVQRVHIKQQVTTAQYARLDHIALEITQNMTAHQIRNRGKVIVNHQEQLTLVQINL